MNELAKSSLCKTTKLTLQLAMTNEKLIIIIYLHVNKTYRHSKYKYWKEGNIALKKIEGQMSDALNSTDFISLRIHTNTKYYFISKLSINVYLQLSSFLLSY